MEQLACNTQRNIINRIRTTGTPPKALVVSYNEFDKIQDQPQALDELLDQFADEIFPVDLDQLQGREYDQDTASAAKGLTVASAPPDWDGMEPTTRHLSYLCARLKRYMLRVQRNGMRPVIICRDDTDKFLAETVACARAMTIGEAKRHLMTSARRRMP